MPLLPKICENPTHQVRNWDIPKAKNAKMPNDDSEANEVAAEEIVPFFKAAASKVVSSSRMQVVIFVKAAGHVTRVYSTL